MALRIPTAEELKSLAQVNHFELNDEELAAFQESNSRHVRLVRPTTPDAGPT